METYIWLDEHINSEENKNYIIELELIYQIKVNTCENINEAIFYLKKYKFKETKIIISGKLYDDFVKIFKEKITEIYVVPKIIVFARYKNQFIKNHIDFYNLNNEFYRLGGVVDKFDDIKEFLNNPIKPIPDVQLTFEQINSKEKLVLPLFFKSLIDSIPNKNIQNYTSSLYDRYSSGNDKIKKLLDQIKNIKNIPIELLSKYYARLYTINSDFYQNINKDLGTENFHKYLPFIKTLYEGVKFKSLPLSEEEILYRGAKISNQELNNIKLFIEKKMEGLPSSIVFSKSFLSFSKNKSQAEKFFKYGNINENISRVLFKLEKKVNDYNLSTHGDISKLSVYPDEEEVLFFPFSTFAIKNMKETIIENEKGYEINLIYLDNYLKDIEGDKILIENKNEIIESEFKKQLCEVGLVKKEKIKKMNNQLIYSSFKNYKQEIIKINKNKDTSEINEIIEINPEQNNKIVGEININIFNVKNYIQIINSFENFKRKNIEYQEQTDDRKYENEKEIKDNIEIKINGKEQNFSYFYKFKKLGKYKIEYIFKKPLIKTNHMFSDCENLIKLDLSKFNTEKITNMSCMFLNCKSLNNINLTNFKTEKVSDMSYLFAFCKSLKILDLSGFNTKNVTDMNNMFIDCDKLMYLDLSNFNTEKVLNMSYMFSGNKSLKYLDLSNFDTRNVKNIYDMFFECYLQNNRIVNTKDEKIIEELNNCLRLKKSYYYNK